MNRSDNMRADLISNDNGRLFLAKQADLNNWHSQSIMLGGNHPIIGVVDSRVYPNTRHGYMPLRMTWKVKQVYNNPVIPGLDDYMYSKVEI